MDRPTDMARVELPTQRPVIDVMAGCGPHGSLVWLNLYRERGAFLTVDEACNLAAGLTAMAAITARYVASQAESQGA